MHDLKAHPATHVRPDTTRFHETAVHRVIAAMHTHLQEVFSLEQMAEVAIMSPFHFNRTFRGVTGLPPGHFLTALRLQAARRMLLTTEQTVTDVCFDVGYSSLGTFTRTFTHVFGVSPRRLRSYAAARPAAWESPSRPSRPASAGAAPVDITVNAPAEFAGLIFLGVFRASLPHGVPVACRLLRRPGTLTLHTAPGQCHVYGIAVPQPITARQLLILDDALRGGVRNVDVRADAPPVRVNLELRAPSPFDPPVLVTLPLLLQRRRQLASTLHTARSPEAVA